MNLNLNSCCKFSIFPNKKNNETYNVDLKIVNKKSFLIYSESIKGVLYPEKMQLKWRERTLKDIGILGIGLSIPIPQRKPSGTFHKIKLKHRNNYILEIIYDEEKIMFSRGMKSEKPLISMPLVTFIAMQSLDLAYKHILNDEILDHLNK